MIERVDAVRAERMIADRTRTLDVLPAEVYRKEHLPGATNLPLESFEPWQVESFDRAEPVLVYCFDQHCDLSARASARLDHMGFRRVHDLIGGRAAWTALGLPTEGTVGDDGRIGGRAMPIPTVPVDATIADATAVAGARFLIPVTTPEAVVVGAVALADLAKPPATPVVDVMDPAPRTIRPELRVDKAVEQLRKDGLEHVLVTAVNGVLIGVIVTAEVDS